MLACSRTIERGEGIKVERTRYIGDYGADLVTTNNGVKTVIQAKRYKCRMVSGQQNLTEAIEIKEHPQKSWPFSLK
jgi:HJR/Mrr/RecB family endonuclease